MNFVERRAPVLQLNLDRFEEGNAFLFAVLGVISFGRRFEAAIDACGPVAAATSGVSVGEDDVLHAVLGLLALRKQFERGVQSVALAPAPSSRTADPNRGDLSTRYELLR